MRKPDRAQKPIQFFAATLPYEQLPDYPDIGSWKTNRDGSPAFIGAADTGNDISNAAILIHEYVECFFCWLHGIKEADVTAFDQKWFKEHGPFDGEPGNDPSAPYYLWHRVATCFERDFIEHAGMTWEEHQENCNKFS